MNKTTIVILSFLTIAYAQVHAMDNIGRKRSTEEHMQADACIKVMGSFKLANNIKKSFLRLKDFDKRMNEDEKISKITDLLSSYQVAHERFVHNKFLCKPENLLPKYLKEYHFCDMQTQDNFQAKANSLLGEYVLELHQWFEEMRSTEYQALLIPYRLITG